jgi:hypothetical protein
MRAMQHVSLTIAIMSLIHVFTPGLEAQNQNRNREDRIREGACFYMDSDYGGDSFCMDAGQGIRDVEPRYNDEISSIRVFGKARVVIFEHKNFGGASSVISSDVPGLGGWNDKITSIRIEYGQRGFRGGSDEPPRRENPGRQYGNLPGRNEPRNGACFYVDGNYRGENFCLKTGERLRKVEDRFNDSISSVRILGRAQVIVHEHDNFGGASRTIVNDAPVLPGFNDTISSIEVR